MAVSTSPTTSVRQWKMEEEGLLDNTYGYDDIVMVYDKNLRGDVEIGYQDDARKWVNDRRKWPSPKEVLRSGWVRDGDQLFQYGQNGPIILRRPLFTSPCQSEVKSRNTFYLSEAAVKAIAYFSNRPDQGQFCNAKYNGQKSVGTSRYGKVYRMMLPWDLSDPKEMAEFEFAVGQMAESKRGKLPDPHRLAEKVSEEEIATIKQQIAAIKSVHQVIQEKAVQAVNHFFENPLQDLFIAGLLTGAGFHLATKMDKVPRLSLLLLAFIRNNPVVFAGMAIGGLLIFNAYADYQIIENTPEDWQRIYQSEGWFREMLVGDDLNWLEAFNMSWLNLWPGADHSKYNPLVLQNWLSTHSLMADWLSRPVSH